MCDDVERNFTFFGGLKADLREDLLAVVADAPRHREVLDPLLQSIAKSISHARELLASHPGNAELLSDLKFFLHMKEGVVELML